MDKDISKMKLKANATYRGLSNDKSGQGVDMKSLIQAEAMAGLEINSRKIESQTCDLQRLNADNSDLKTLQL